MTGWCVASSFWLELLEIEGVEGISQAGWRRGRQEGKQKKKKKKRRDACEEASVKKSPAKPEEVPGVRKGGGGLVLGARSQWAWVQGHAVGEHGGVGSGGGCAWTRLLVLSVGWGFVCFGWGGGLYLMEAAETDKGRDKESMESPVKRFIRQWLSPSANKKKKTKTDEGKVVLLEIESDSDVVLDQENTGARVTQTPTTQKKGGTTETKRQPITTRKRGYRRHEQHEIVIQGHLPERVTHA